MRSFESTSGSSASSEPAGRACGLNRFAWVAIHGAGAAAPGVWRGLLILFACLAGCPAHPPTVRPPPSLPTPAAPRLALSVPDGAFEDLGEGLVRTVRVSLRNPGEIPVALLSLSAGGRGVGARRLAVAGSAGRLRAFGYVPPGEEARYKLGVHFAEPGDGDLVLTARVRLLPGTSGRVMEEVDIAATGEELELELIIPVVVPPRNFARASADARIGGSDEGLYSRTMGAWVLLKGNETFVVRVGETTRFPGLTLNAAALLDRYEEEVPVLDAAGRLMLVPKGRPLDLLLERARIEERTLTTTRTPDQMEVLVVE